MADKLKVKFLTVIWGDRYIEEFARVSLPSYLADGNLPSLASDTDLEIAIMTSRDSIHKFNEEPIFEKIKALCPLRYIFIDDLITTGNYGVTLTLAYARGIMDSGPEQTSTHFLFMNSDFVLADGSLRTLVARLRDGHHCIMAPSLRASSETALPELIAAVDRATDTLAMPPRRMVQLAFDNLHPTVIAKTITQNFVTCTTHNQIYWQVDETTLLARYHLIFMLAIKPEVPLGPINSYCDYGFVPELVPSGKFSILDDSDEFFMLELQPGLQEAQYLRCGTSTLIEIAQELGSWTTSEHRRFAKKDVVFRSNELPANFEQSRLGAADYVTRLHRIMPNPPLDHVDHFYWKFGMQAWALLKFAGNPIPEQLPPEVNASKFTPMVAVAPISNAEQSIRHQVGKRLTDAYIELINRVRISAGIVPNVPIWHYLWQDSRLILKWIKAVKHRPHTKNVMICRASSPLASSLPKLAPFEVVDPDKFIAGIATTKDDMRDVDKENYDNIFLQIYRADLHQSRKILESAESRIKPDGMIAIHVWHENSETDQSNFSFELGQYVTEVLPRNWLGYRVHASFAGGLAKRRLRVAERFLFRYLVPTTIRRLPYLAAALMLWPVVAVLTAMNNLRLRNRSSKCPRYCSSALLSLTRIPCPTAKGTPSSK